MASRVAGATGSTDRIWSCVEDWTGLAVRVICGNHLGICPARHPALGQLFLIKRLVIDCGHPCQSSPPRLRLIFPARLSSRFPPFAFVRRAGRPTLHQRVSGWPKLENSAQRSTFVSCKAHCQHVSSFPTTAVPATNFFTRPQVSSSSSSAPFINCRNTLSFVSTDQSTSVSSPAACSLTCIASSRLGAGVRVSCVGAPAACSPALVGLE